MINLQAMNETARQSHPRTTRRSLLAILFGAVAVKFVPKPQFNSGIAIARAYKDNGHTFYAFDFTARMEQANRELSKILHTYNKDLGGDMGFLAGDRW